MNTVLVPGGPVPASSVGLDHVRLHMSTPALHLTKHPAKKKKEKSLSKQHRMDGTNEMGMVQGLGMASCTTSLGGGEGGGGGGGKGAKKVKCISKIG